MILRRLQKLTLDYIDSSVIFILYYGLGKQNNEDAFVK